MPERTVLDASALLALLANEPGTDMVVFSIQNGAFMSAVNSSEAAAKLFEYGVPEEDVQTIFDSLSIEIAAFDHEQALLAGKLRPPTGQAGLSFGDRACLALGMKLGLPVLTADKAWTQLDVPVEIRLIR